MALQAQVFQSLSLVFFSLEIASDSSAWIRDLVGSFLSVQHSRSCVWVMNLLD